MAKSRSRSSTPPEVAPVKNGLISRAVNGLADALFPSGNPFNQAASDQVEDVATLFRYNRNYLVSNMRQLLSQSYAEHGLLQTIVDVPVDDGLRGGVGITSKQLSPDQISELMRYLDEGDVLASVVGQAHKWNRLYGGAGILILTDQDPETPFSIEELAQNDKLDFRAVDMWELDSDSVQGADEQKIFLGSTAPFFRYYGHKIHSSRVMVMKGRVAPSWLRPRLRGWGLSVAEALVSSVNQYLKSKGLAFEVLDEFKIDVFRMADLNSTIFSDGGEERVRRRMSLANQQKNYLQALVMDKNDEYEQKQVSFAGLADMMREIRLQVAADMRMPLTKIFGMSAAGLNAGEDDIENYNSMVESTIRGKAKYEIIRIIQIKARQLYGLTVTDLECTFPSLRILSSTDEEAVKTQQFARVKATQDSGLCTLKEFKTAMNSANLFPIALNVEIEKIETAPTPDGAPGEGSAFGESSTADEEEKARETETAEE